MHHRYIVGHYARHRLRDAPDWSPGCLALLGVFLMVFGGAIFFALMLNLF